MKREKVFKYKNLNKFKSSIKDYEIGKIIQIERKGTGKKKQIKGMSHIMQEN